MEQTKKRLTNISKLEDANEAGGKCSNKCTLILTEGDSAKALVMAGLAVVGRRYYGVFPLKGKLLNVRDAKHTRILNNAEIQNLVKILGLQRDKTYESVSSLRYGHIMIMTDQDHDGSHIKGLIINFLHTFWPSLLKVPNFLSEFVTPLLKATNKKNRQVLPFYSMHDCKAWIESLQGNIDGWTIKYYKGLGTSSSTEGKEYFNDLDRHKKYFLWSDDSQDANAIELAFSRKRTEDRKNWLRQYKPGSGLDSKEKYIKFTDFVHKELIHFSIADLQRSIPSVMDGLKPGQRKALFCAFTGKLFKETKVSQFGGYVVEKSSYHHGDHSLHKSIIGMAQDFVGSNNINLFQPYGQFGTRCQGGKDHASPRYISTCLQRMSRIIFPKEDDVLLDYVREDGITVEPFWYAPIIPMVLVNGSGGVGTGWSTCTPKFNPLEIIANIKRLLNDEPMEIMAPWYRGFKGTLEKSTKKGVGIYTFCGAIEEVNEGTLMITELPVRCWTQDYKKFLDSIIESNDKLKDGDEATEGFIKGFRDLSTDTVAQFEVYMEPKKLLMVKNEGLRNKFKLTSLIRTSNMHLYTPKGMIKRYANAEEILEEFYDVRRALYEKRKNYYGQHLEKQLLKLVNTVRFIQAFINGELVLNRKKKAELVSELRERGFSPMPQMGVVNSQGVSDYNYLLSMSFCTLTYEKMEELKSEEERVSQELKKLKKVDPKSLWMKDLDALQTALEQDKSYEKTSTCCMVDVARQPKRNKEPVPSRVTEHVRQLEQLISECELMSSHSSGVPVLGKKRKASPTTLLEECSPLKLVARPRRAVAKKNIITVRKKDCGYGDDESSSEEDDGDVDEDEVPSTSSDGD